MDNHSASTVTRISITSLLVLALASFAYSGIKMPPSAHTEPLVEAQILQKMRAILSEGRFWGNLAVDQKELKTVLFVATAKADEFGFNVLVVVPEIQWTFELHSCAGELPILIQGSGPTVQKVDAEGYLSAQMRRYSSFVETATKTDHRIAMETEPTILFNVDTDLKKKRIGQIESALGELLHKLGLRIRIANFSRFTDQIDVLVPSAGTMVTMSVVHAACGQETIEVGREHHLKDVRRDLRQKIQENSQTATLN